MPDSILPKVVISLDFEMRWGMHDVYGLDFTAYRENLEQHRYVVPALLNELAAHNIRATWAVVGAIGCESWEEYFERAPRAPEYRDFQFAVKSEYADLDPDGMLHFAPDLMHRIIATTGQELGTHTFSHLYLREDGVTAEDVAADLAAVSKLYAERFGTAARSLVFPRNQAAFLDTVRRSFIKIWRGNPDTWYHECEDSRHNGLLPRALKLVDSLNPLSKRASLPVNDMTRASTFLRLALPAPLWDAHLLKIRRELASLAPGELFHIWFHPDNLGSDTKRRLSRLEQVLELIAEQQSRGKLMSCSMGDLVAV